MTAETLLPCPFCGSADLNRYHGHGGHKVKCFGCGVSGVLVTVWNLRALAAPSTGAGDAVREAETLAALTAWLVDQQQGSQQLRDSARRNGDTLGAAIHAEAVSTLAQVRGWLLSRAALATDATEGR